MNPTDSWRCPSPVARAPRYTQRLSPEDLSKKSALPVEITRVDFDEPVSVGKTIESIGLSSCGATYKWYRKQSHISTLRGNGCLLIPKSEQLIGQARCITHYCLGLSVPDRHRIVGLLG